ncbi:MAG: hypothetical protein Q7S65_04520 [Nanoarchaeota archaeon]|nr:hypothetical protein [Nanoarchaeota archaeon]
MNHSDAGEGQARKLFEGEWGAKEGMAILGLAYTISGVVYLAGGFGSFSRPPEPEYRQTRAPAPSPAQPKPQQDVPAAPLATPLEDIVETHNPCLIAFNDVNRDGKEDITLGYEGGGVRLLSQPDGTYLLFAVPPSDSVLASLQEARVGKDTSFLNNDVRGIDQPSGIVTSRSEADRATFATYCRDGLKYYPERTSLPVERPGMLFLANTAENNVFRTTIGEQKYHVNVNYPLRVEKQ